MAKNTCLTSALIKGDVIRDVENQREAVLRQADGLVELMKERGYENLMDFLPKGHEDDVLEGDIISYLSGGITTREQFANSTDSSAVIRLSNRVQDFASALVTADKDFFKFAVDSQSEEVINLLRYQNTRKLVPQKMYSWLNWHKKIIGDKFDIHGAYIQLVNRVPIVREMNEYMKRYLNLNRSAGESLARRFEDVMKHRGRNVSNILQGGKGRAFLEQTLKIFDPTYGIIRRDFYAKKNKALLINAFSEHTRKYLQESGELPKGLDETEEGFRDFMLSLFNESFSTVKDIWTLNYGEEIATKMLRGDYLKTSIKWDDVADNNTSILGLQKTNIRGLNEMWSYVSPYMRSDNREPFRKVFERFSLENDPETGEPVAPIRMFYLPYRMSEEDRIANEQRIASELGGKLNNDDEYTSDDFVRSLFMFLEERKTDSDSEGVSDYMTVAMMQRLEQLTLGVNTLATRLFARGTEGYLEREALSNMDLTMKQGIQKYVDNAIYQATPAKRPDREGSAMTQNKMRLKQVMRLSSVFPAMMISRAASGIRNLVGAGMSLLNADWMGYAMNTNFEKAYRQNDPLALKINGIVEEGYLSPGLASAFIDSHRFIEIQAEKHGISQEKAIDRFLTGLETKINKFADWTTSGYFMRNIKWYHNTFTVPGSERILRSYVKNLMYQTVNADTMMLRNLRHHQTSDIQYKLRGLLSEDNPNEIRSGIEQIRGLAERQLNIANRHSNKEMASKYTALIKDLDSETFNKKGDGIAQFLEYEAVLSDRELEEIINVSGRQWKARVDEQLGDFSPAGKPMIENLYLRNADTYGDIVLGGILKASSFFNVVSRTTSVAYMQGLHNAVGTMIGGTGKEAAGWETGLKGMTSFEFGGAATISVGLGTILTVYGLLAGLFKRNVMIGSALSMNPMSGYVAPARLVGMESLTIWGALSGMGVSVPPEIREQVYRDNIRWATGAIAGKSASQLYEEGLEGERDFNPINYITSVAEDLFNLPETLSYGLKTIRLDGDLDRYYDWRQEYNNALVPINHFAPVYAVQKATESLVDIFAPKDDRGYRIATSNAVRAAQNWVGLSVWTHIRDENLRRPTFQHPRVRAKTDIVEDLGRTRRMNRPEMNIPRERLTRLHRGLLTRQNRIQGG